MIVVDASVMVNAVGDDGPDGRAARSRLAVEEAAAPDLVDVETAAVLRRRWLHGDLDGERFDAAVNDLLALPVARYPASPLLRRAVELRSNVTVYDACYVALAEALDATLVTADERLASAPGVGCRVNVMQRKDQG